MEGNNYLESKGRNVISRKSWTAYVAPTFILTILLLVLASFQLFLGIIPIALLIITILTIRSHELYIDDDGVWIYRGIFPWSKGVNGVKWRDLDDAVYFTGFVSWALKSYTLKVSHRFTKDSEIVLTHMRLGDSAVKEINSQLKSYVNSQNDPTHQNRTLN